MSTRRRFLSAAGLSGAGLAGALVAPSILASPAFADPADGTEPVRRSRSAGTAFGGLRVVRKRPGTPSKPLIVLPLGYSFAPEAKYHFASRAQYYTFITGAANKAVEVTIAWPGNQIEALIGDNGPIEVRPITPDRSVVRAVVPVSSASATAGTLQIRSAPPTVAGIMYRVEHNNPDRAAGVWADQPWPETERRAVVNYLIAAEMVIRASGLAATAAARKHFFYITGFETYTTLHPDNPPHWHLGYYPGDFSAPGVHMPHLLLDRSGRITRNGMDITGKKRQNFYPGQPAAIHDLDGRLVVTLTIRRDGGLAVRTPAGREFGIAAPSAGDFGSGVRVLRDGKPWRTVSATDDTRTGLLTARIRGNGGSSIRFRYDRNVGTILA